MITKSPASGCLFCETTCFGSKVVVVCANLGLSVQANMTCLLIIMTIKYIQTNKNTETDLQIKSLNFSGHIQ